MSARLDWLSRRARSAGRLAVATVLGPLVRPREAPVLVLGNQKSGTTAVAAALGSATGLPVTQDLVREIVAPRFDRVASGTETIEDLVERNAWDFRRPIVKEPHLTPLCTELRQRFPDSPIGLVVRDPADNIRSILDRLGVAAADVERALDRPVRNRRGWELVLDGSWLGDEADTVFDHLCLRWVRCARVAERDDVVTLRYEDFLEDRSAAIDRFASGLGLPSEHGRADAGAAVAHQPRGANRGVDPRQFFTPDQLARIEEICGPVKQTLGYA